MRNKRYRGDYQVTIDEKNRKSLEYKGDYYEVNSSRDEINKYIKLNAVTAIGLFILHMIMSFLNSEGTRTFYVVFPYIFSLLTVCFMISGVMKALSSRKKEKLELYDYEKGYARIYHSIVGCMILSGNCVLTNMILLFVHFQSLILWKEICFIVIAAMNCIISFYVMKYDKQMDRTIRIQKKKEHETEFEEEVSQE